MTRWGICAVLVAVLLVTLAGCGGSAKPVTPAGSVDVTFRSGPDTLYGTFQRPASRAGELTAALIISGSGPTDRNGNNPQLAHLDTNRNFAAALAGDGVASFRYDKVGAGRTGLGTHAGGAAIDFNLYAQEVLDAYRTLARRPGVDPRRLIVVGHSEGALFATWLADHLAGTPDAPRELVLAAPAGRRYLDILGAQYTALYRKAEAAGQLSPGATAERIAGINDAFGRLRSTGRAPTTFADPAIAELMSPANAPFLYQADRQDPAELARRLPIGTRVLVLRGLKDVQVTAEDVDLLMSAMAADHLTAQRADIANADHLFKVVTGVPNPDVDYANAGRPFAPEVVAVLRRFVVRN